MVPPQKSRLHHIFTTVMQYRDAVIVGDAPVGDGEDPLPLAVLAPAPPDGVVAEVGHHAREQDVLALAELPGRRRRLPDERLVLGGGGWNERGGTVSAGELAAR